MCLLLTTTAPVYPLCLKKKNQKKHILDRIWVHITDPCEFLSGVSRFFPPLKKFVCESHSAGVLKFS